MRLGLGVRCRGMGGIAEIRGGLIKLYDLSTFSAADASRCQSVLASSGHDANSMEEVAQHVVRYFYEQFRHGADGMRSLVLARFYKTHLLSALPTELSEQLKQNLGETPLSAGARCLTLLATAGARPEWNERTKSQGHQVIPLLSEEAIAQMPMVTALFRQLGMETRQILNPTSDLLLDDSRITYNIFYVPEAMGSPYVPAQMNFVIPYRVRSVIGFGGVFATGDVFSVILFSRLAIDKRCADLFRSIALGVKIAALPFARRAFASPVSSANSESNITGPAPRSR
jgi:two-component system NtrC family sensor kinase